MASQDTKILSPENVPMFTAVAFILAITAMSFGLFAYKTVRQATVGLAVLQVGKARLDEKKEQAQNGRVDALEKRLAALEARAQKLEQSATAMASAAPAAPATK